MNKALEIIKIHKSTILYLIFGVSSTVINMIIYYICYDIMRINNVVSTLLAWMAAVILLAIAGVYF